MQKNQAITVWDIPTRLFHWALVGVVIYAAWTGFFAASPALDLHIQAGTLALVYVFWRVIWGFLGPQYVRFSDFVTSPRVALTHLGALRRGRAARHLGHNPLGGAMILGLLAIILALGLTGAASLGGIFKAGPAAFAFDFSLGDKAKSVHQVLAFLFMALIATHVAGAIFESLRTRENLPGAMITGRKQLRNTPVGETMLSPRRWVALGILIVGLGGTVWASAHLGSLPAKGAGLAIPDPDYQSECSDCHMAFHPSLLPASAWSLLMADMADHFGEDASLDDQTTQDLRLWLGANAAETADTKPAHMLRCTDPEHPFTISKTPFWRDTHNAIPAETFKRAPIHSQSNCLACHEDAKTGFFYPGDIEIPKEPQT